MRDTLIKRAFIAFLGVTLQISDFGTPIFVISTPKNISKKSSDPGVLFLHPKSRIEWTIGLANSHRNYWAAKSSSYVIKMASSSIFSKLSYAIL